MYRLGSGGKSFTSQVALNMPAGQTFWPDAIFSSSAILSSIGGWVSQQAVIPALMVLQRIVNAHGSGGMVHLLERLIILLELFQCVQQADRIPGELHPAYVGQ